MSQRSADMALCLPTFSADMALCLPTFNHFLILNKTSLSLSLSLSSPSTLYHLMSSLAPRIRGMSSPFSREWPRSRKPTPWSKIKVLIGLSVLDGRRC